jgi:hypothetical protein
MDTIVARIEFAFAHVPRPGDTELAEPGADESAVAELEAVDDWHELADGAIERSAGALTDLSAAGFRHYLPAYMRWICRHGDDRPDSPVLAATFAALTPDQDEEGAHLSGKLSLLGAEQTACIAAFFDRVAHHPGAQDARAYWRMRAGYLPRPS